RELAAIAVVDLVQSITSLSAVAEIIDRALRISMDRVTEAHVTGRVLSAAAAGAWVAEGQPIPVRALNASAAILRPRRLGVIAGNTQEMAASANFENVVRQTPGEAASLLLDQIMVSADAVDASAPAGLFAGVPPITAAAGGGSAAMTADIKALFGAL